MASVTIFLEAYDDVPDYDVLNRLICQWRKVEEENRQLCGLPSIVEEYPGCFSYRRGDGSNNDGGAGGNGDSNSTFTPPWVDANATYTSPADYYAEPDSGRRRELRGSIRSYDDNNSNQRAGSTVKEGLYGGFKKKPISAHDIIMHNAMRADGDPVRKIVLDDRDTEPNDADFDWDEFIASIYQQEEEQVEGDPGDRHLMDYEHVGPWFNYWPMIGCKTEYYYRYSGTQTVPPCYGQFNPDTLGSRGFTNHWRIMKDPIRVSRRQIKELHRLLRERIAPPDDPIRPCRPDTAAKPDPDDPSKVSTARPLQSYHEAHFKVFCECENWGSKWNEDKAWCQIQDKNERLFDHPYNYRTEGF